MNFRDSLIEENKEIYEFYYNGKICSAKLKGSLDKNERKNLHNKLVNIVINLQNESDYDYLSNINKLIIEFKL